MVASSAEKLSNSRVIELTGDVTGYCNFDGSENTSLETTIISFSHNHDSRYYQQSEIDSLLTNYSPIDHIHSFLENGDGIKSFRYDGSSVVEVAVDFDNNGSENQASRSDHIHSQYVTSEDGNDLYIASIDVSGDSIRALDGNGEVHNSLAVPWSLTLGASEGSVGLSLNSTELNNEINKVVRTDSNGDVQFENIIAGNIIADSITVNDIDVDHYLKNNSDCIPETTDTYSLGSSASKWSSVYANSATISNGDLIVDGGNITLTTGVLNGISTSAQYADLAEIYITDQQYKIGTVLCQYLESDEYELTECIEECSLNVIGVISEKPGVILNSKDKDKENAQPVALTGKTPIRIVGAIEKGDILVSAGERMCEEISIKR